MPTRTLYVPGDAIAEGYFPIVAPPPPSPGQIVAHRGWSTAREALLAAVNAGPGMAALLGPPGTGKTLLLHDVARALRADRPDVLLVDRGDAVPDTLHGVVLIDEADRLDTDALAALASRADLAIVLAALPSFADRLARMPGAMIVPLGPIDEDEVPRFVRERLVQLGHAPDLLTLSAITALFERSGSIPRLLHTLLGLAVFAASLEGAERVTPKDVARAVQFRDGEEIAADPPVAPETVTEPIPSVDNASLAAVASPSLYRRWMAGALAALLLCVGAAASLFQRGAPDRANRPAEPALAIVEAGGTPGPAPPEPAPTMPEPPVPPAPVAAPILPSGSLTRVVLSYPTGDPGAAQRAADVARQLRGEGVTVGEPVPVAPRATAPSLLYYFTQDRDGATAIGRRLDDRFGEATLARLPRRSALPRPGTIELLLSSSSP